MIHGGGHSDPGWHLIVQQTANPRAEGGRNRIIFSLVPAAVGSEDGPSQVAFQLLEYLHCLASGLSDHQQR